MIPFPVKKNYLSLELDSCHSNSTSNNHHVTNIPARNVPIQILRYNFVSYLTFREQSTILSHISKSFNILATFAREEQDWKDHMINASALGLIGKDDELSLGDYLRWQYAKQSIDSTTSYLFLEIFNKKIHYIKKIKNLADDSLKQFSLSLSTLNQVNLKQIVKPIVDLRNDFFFEQTSKCRFLEKLHIEFIHEEIEQNDYSVSRHELHSSHFAPQSGFVHFLQKCKKVKLKFDFNGNFDVPLQDYIDFILNSINRCVSIDPHFIMPLDYLRIGYLSLDSTWIPMLHYSLNLTHFTYIEGFSDQIITENFVNALANCTQLEFINISGLQQFQSNNKGELTICHDQAFANLLNSCTRLRKFSYQSYLGLGDLSFKSIINHPRIEKLSITPAFSTQIFEHEYSCPSLTDLELEISSLGSEFKRYGGSNDLGNRIIESINTVTRASAKFFPNLTKFSIFADRISINEGILLSFESFSKLTEFSLYSINQYPSITSLNILANLPRLQIFRLNIIKDDLAPGVISSGENHLNKRFKVSRKPNSNTYECIPKR